MVVLLDIHILVFYVFMLFAKCFSHRIRSYSRAAIYNVETIIRLRFLLIFLLILFVNISAICLFVRLYIIKLNYISYTR